jgi:hypothetical protein
MSLIRIYNSWKDVPKIIKDFIKEKREENNGELPCIPNCYKSWGKWIVPLERPLALRAKWTGVLTFEPKVECDSEPKVKSLRDSEYKIFWEHSDIAFWNDDSQLDCCHDFDPEKDIDDDYPLVVKLRKKRRL